MMIILGLQAMSCLGDAYLHKIFQLSKGGTQLELVGIHIKGVEGCSGEVRAGCLNTTPKSSKSVLHK